MNLRLDDLGASSKQYERWSRHRWANVWPLHDRRLFGAWGPYRELAPWQMEIIFSACARARRVLIVAITANWVQPPRPAPSRCRSTAGRTASRIVGDPSRAGSAVTAPGIGSRRRSSPRSAASGSATRSAYL